MLDFKPSKRHIFIEQEEPLWLKILGGASFVIFVLLLCFI
jgi:hypothetical protein